MKWEYRTERIDTSGMYRTKQGYIPCDGTIWSESAMPGKWENINDLGAEGWELVAVFGAEGDEAHAIFKRPVEALGQEAE